MEWHLFKKSKKKLFRSFILLFILIDDEDDDGDVDGGHSLNAGLIQLSRTGNCARKNSVKIRAAGNARGEIRKLKFSTSPCLPLALN